MLIHAQKHTNKKPTTHTNNANALKTPLQNTYKTLYRSVRSDKITSKNTTKQKRTFQKNHNLHIFAFYIVGEHCVSNGERKTRENKTRFTSYGRKILYIKTIQKNTM